MVVVVVADGVLVGVVLVLYCLFVLDVVGFSVVLSRWGCNVVVVGVAGVVVVVCGVVVVGVGCVWGSDCRRCRRCR